MAKILFQFKLFDCKLSHLDAPAPPGLAWASEDTMSLLFYSQGQDHYNLDPDLKVVLDTFAPGLP